MKVCLISLGLKYKESVCLCVWTHCIQRPSTNQRIWGGPEATHRANRVSFFDPFLRVNYATQNGYCYGTNDGHSVPHDTWANQNKKIKCVGSELDLRDKKLGTPCSCFPRSRTSVRATSDSMPLSACLAFHLFTLTAPDPVEFSPLSAPHFS